MTGAKKLIDAILSKLAASTHRNWPFEDTISVFWGEFRRPLAALDRCTLNKGAFAFKIVRGALKWLLKGGSCLIEVAATAGLTVLLTKVLKSEKIFTHQLKLFAHWVNLHIFLSSADFLIEFFSSKLTLLKSSFGNTIRVSNSLDPDQAQHFVRPDLGPNCL